MKPPSTLLTSLTSYWKMEEGTGLTRNDSVGTNHLADNASVTQIAGKVLNAAHFTRTSSQFLNKASNSTLQTGDIDFTVAAWVMLDTVGQIGTIMGKFGLSGTREYVLRVNSAPATASFVVSPAGTSVVLIDSTRVLTTGVWYLITAWHDSVGNTINIQVNDDAVNSTSHSTGVAVLTTEFNIGRAANNAQFWDGRIDEAAFWKKALTASERAEFYNGGSGTTYPF